MRVRIRACNFMRLRLRLLSLVLFLLFIRIDAAPTPAPAKELMRLLEATVPAPQNHFLAYCI
jgi:hypothetical protein